MRKKIPNFSINSSYFGLLMMCLSVPTVSACYWSWSQRSFLGMVMTAICILILFWVFFSQDKLVIHWVIFEANEIYIRGCHGFISIRRVDILSIYAGTSPIDEESFLTKAIVLEIKLNNDAITNELINSGFSEKKNFINTISIGLTGVNMTVTEINHTIKNWMEDGRMLKK
jgi:hypothetical protein